MTNNATSDTWDSQLLRQECASEVALSVREVETLPFRPHVFSFVTNKSDIPVLLRRQQHVTLFFSKAQVNILIPGKNTGILSVNLPTISK
jgi:hypothetical protein